MIKKIQLYIEDNCLLAQGDSVLCALSGGADSVCLLSVLLALQERYALSVAAVHVNHQLRGEEAERDARFCETLCARLGVKLHMYTVDVNAYAKAHGLGIEAAARTVRYAHFDALCARFGYRKVAVAHNAQDNAETILMHLMRGSGLDGLRGILPQRDNIIRPLLCVDRDEIEVYLKDKELTFVTDSTNLQTQYSRNRVRHELMELICKAYNPNIVHTLLETSYLLSRDAEFLNVQAQAAAEKAVTVKENKVFVHAREYAALPEAVALRVMKDAVSRHMQKQTDIPFDTVKRCHELCRGKETGKCVTLPDGGSAAMEHGRLVLSDALPVQEYMYSLPADSSVYVPEGNAVISAWVTDVKEKDTETTVYFDLDKIVLPLCVRNRRKGDRVQLSGMKGTKKLQDYFIDTKVARSERDLWPLVCSGEDILWICAKRKSAMCETDEKTNQFLKLTYEEREA